MASAIWFSSLVVFRVPTLPQVKRFCHHRLPKSGAQCGVGPASCHGLYSLSKITTNIVWLWTLLFPLVGPSFHLVSLEAQINVPCGFNSYAWRAYSIEFHRLLRHHLHADFSLKMFVQIRNKNKKWHTTPLLHFQSGASSCNRGLRKPATLLELSPSTAALISTWTCFHWLCQA